MSLRIAVLILLEVYRVHMQAANPPMLTHASMDVGNIISIVIPESPDENINIEQLTGEFRQQLERIKKQSRASKVEHGLVTLKRVLPEMSREEKRKTLPLIRRVLHGRRVTNSGSMKNWTREAPRIEQMREGGQFVKSRSAGIPEERRIYRDYGEPSNREALTMHIDQSVTEKEEYHQDNEGSYASHREEAGRENPIRRSDQIAPNDQIVPEDDPSSSKITQSGPPQEWNSQNWEEPSRGNTRVYQETSTVDCNYKLDHATHQKEPGNEIVQNDRYDKLARLPEHRVNVPEEPNVDCTRLDQQITSRYPFPRTDGAYNAKRNLNNVRAFELADMPGLVNYPKEYEINRALNPDCDSIKKNRSEQCFKDHERNRDLSFNKQHQNTMNFEREGHRALQRIILEPREQSERSNTSGLENIFSESIDDYTTKKKRGHSESEVFRELPPIKSNPGNQMNQWNTTTHDDRHSSNDMKGPPNLYEMFGEKDVNPGLAHIQTEQGGFRSNVDNETKVAASQHFANYGSDGQVLRIQRAIHGIHYENETPKLPSNVTQIIREDHEHQRNKSINEQLQHLFKSPSLPKAIYNSIILFHINESDGHDESTREGFTEVGKPQSTAFPSMIEPTSPTNHEVPKVLRSTTDSSQIRTTKDFVIKPHAIVKF